MNDGKQPAALKVEVVAGSGEEGLDDGPLDKCSFRFPYALCQFDGTLFVADDTIRAVDGVLGGTVSGFETSLTAALLTAVPSLPKELARVMVQYPRPIGVRTVAGSDTGHTDGPAREAEFNAPTDRHCH
jgi:hypothetical protein